MTFLKRIFTGFICTLILQGTMVGMKCNKQPKEKQKEVSILEHVDITKRLISYTLFIAMNTRHNTEFFEFFMTKNGLTYSNKNNLYIVPGGKNKAIPYSTMPLYIICQALNFVERTEVHYDKIKDCPHLIYYTLSKGLLVAINYLTWFSTDLLLTSEDEKIIEKFEKHFKNIKPEPKNTDKLKAFFNQFTYMTTKLLTPVLNIFYGCRFISKNEKTISRIIENFFDAIEAENLLNFYKDFIEGKQLFKE